MRLFTATLAHETSSFSPIPTSIENFRRALLHRPSRAEMVEGRLVAVECGLTAKGIARGHEVIESVGAAATPAGLLARGDYEMLRDEILADLSRALPIDAIALFLHGAQMAQGYDDCEGDLLARMRTLAGPRIPIGVEIDLHGNVTDAMVDNATVIIACKEYPHTDFPERADELLDVLEAAVRHDVKPHMVRRRVPMLGVFHTTREPMSRFVLKMKEVERRHGVLSVSAVHGFPWADTPYVGAAILVTTDADPDLAATLADELADAFFAIREEATVPIVSTEAALDDALRSPTELTIVADTADNAGGGAASDSTVLLRALLARGVNNAVIGMIWDPVAVSFAFAAGEGTVLSLRIGGKSGPLSGDPVDVIVTVKCLTTDAHQIAFGIRQALGSTALVEVGGLQILLSSEREQVHSPEAFTSSGVDLLSKSLVVLKSAQHFHARFAPLGARIIYAVGPGATSADFQSFTYRRLQRPMWPLDPITTRAEGSA